MRIDVHAHFFPSEYVALLEKFGANRATVGPGKAFGKPNRADDLAERLAAMDLAKVDRQILSIAGVVPYFESEREAVEAARLANDVYAEISRTMPERFSGFAVLPMPHVAASVAEIARALDELGMWGVTVTTSVLDKSLADPDFDPIYTELNKRNAVVFMHPSGFGCGSPQLAKTGLTWPLGAPFEDAMATLELLQSGFPIKFPNIRLIVPHLGGVLPFLLQRLDHMAAGFMPGNGVPRERLRQLWYDTVNAYPDALQLAVKSFGIERLVFGTDWPFWKGEAHQLAADYLSQAGLTAEQIALIDSGNLKSILGGKI